jgi:hypothetical protein
LSILDDKECFAEEEERFLFWGFEAESIEGANVHEGDANGDNSHFYELNIEGRMKIYHEADIVSYALSGSDMQFVDKLRANKQLLDMDSRRTRGINGKIIVAEIGSASRTTR